MTEPSERAGNDRPGDSGGATNRPGTALPPLHGVRVIDLTMVWAGPFATRLIADMGADVIKVEGPASPDLVRGIAGAAPVVPGARPWDESPYFNEYNRNKRGITLDIAKPDGRRALLELVRTADALIENYRADVLDKLGLGAAVLHGERPDLILVSMPGFAKQGLEREMVGYGPTIEQMGGLVALTGYTDSGPQKTGISYGDPVAGIMAAGALVTALLRRQRTGAGATVEVSQRDNLIGLLGEPLMEWSMNRRLWPRRGNRHAWMAPHGCYPCRPLPSEQARPVNRLGQPPDSAVDRWVTIAVATDEQWRSLCAIIGRPELAADERYATALDRYERQDEIDETIAAWTVQCTDDEAMSLLRAGGVPASAVRTALTLTTDPHLAARNFYREVEHPVAGRHRVAGPLWNFSNAPPEIREPAPTFGQHTAAVLGGLVGMSAEQIERLRRQNVTSDAPLVRRLAGA